MVALDLHKLCVCLIMLSTDTATEHTIWGHNDVVGTDHTLSVDDVTNGDITC